MGSTPGPRSGADTSDTGAQEVVLEVRGLTKRYDGTPALVDVSLELERGSITGLLGPNGAGKTTLMKSVLGLVTPSDGTVLVRDRDVTRDPAGAHGDVAAVLEGARNVYWRLTPRENVSLFARLHGVGTADALDRADDVLATVGLEDRADTLVGELSRGMKQRCALGCALVREAPILLLDEPTLGLDPPSRSDLLDLLETLAHRAGRTILVSSHDMDVVEAVCTRTIVLDEGRVVTDESVAALKTAFATETYTVTLEGTVDDAAVSSVADEFELLERRSVRNRTELDVVLRTSDDVYALIDALRREGTSLRSVERTEPDLGSIFAELTDGAGDAE